ncbi:hypothetical protein PEX1_006490 [Penicillium expansum]|uniref:Uncharacterized protein n=1 Tax=Penicillium expansum TaxID=27334 RepID=A0A0A2JPT9_PENEN|nr:hypothetical protein PEX2_075860 [Penicillium expansum]KGO41914.1 hypothetical protein PEXP_109200 [Penicillium expansum]KGO56633.1 hypothetical protein PEX2_075860 [Penicillium expansum]KGO58125.1 hypothetical protein PEX1_006490 [Penicillium expansum]
MFGGSSPRTRETTGTGEMRDLIGTDALGWVSGGDELERCRAVIQSIKDGLMEHSSSEMEKTAVLSHFPFDNHEENADIF